MTDLSFDLERRLIELPDEMLDHLAELHRQEVEDRRRSDPARHFPWHEIQSWVFAAPGEIDRPVRVILISGGNRSGKTHTAKGLWSQFIRRQSPLNAQLRSLDPYTLQPVTKPETEPVVCWVVPPTLEKARNDWIAPEDGMGLKYWAGSRFVHHREQPDNVIYTAIPGVDPWVERNKFDVDKCDRTLLKSQDQGLATFESSAVDLALVDEELMDERKWNSLLLRVGTTNGVIVMTFTPLHGITWSARRYWKPLVERGLARQVAERRWVHAPERGAVVLLAQMGTADNPMAAEYAEEIRHDPEMSEAEKNARLYGQYGYVEGVLLESFSGLDLEHPVGHHELYVVDHLPGDSTSRGRIPGKITDWVLVADPNKSYGALLSAFDGDGNLYFVAEHLEESWPNRMHAEAIRDMERQYARGVVQRYADPGSAGAQAVVDLTDAGLPFMVLKKQWGSVSASIKALRGLAFIDPKHRHPITGKLGAPRVYFYRPGLLRNGECKLVEQLGQARQSADPTAPPDTPHKDHKNRLDLFDCARYTAMIHKGLGGEGDHEGERPVPVQDRLPVDALSQDAPLDPWSGAFDVPEYDWRGM